MKIERQRQERKSDRVTRRKMTRGYITVTKNSASMIYDKGRTSDNRVAVFHPVTYVWKHIRYLRRKSSPENEPWLYRSFGNRRNDYSTSRLKFDEPYSVLINFQNNFVERRQRKGKTTRAGKTQFRREISIKPKEIRACKSPLIFHQACT